jgi:hypothetical protein
VDVWLERGGNLRIVVVMVGATFMMDMFMFRMLVMLSFVRMPMIIIVFFSRVIRDMRRIGILAMTMIAVSEYS